MVGGHIIENVHTVLMTGRNARKIWVVDGEDECIVHAEEAAECLRPGERIWWQAGEIYARNDAICFEKIGFTNRPSLQELRELK